MKAEKLLHLTLEENGYEEFVTKGSGFSQTIVEAMERYAKYYHESKVKKLNIDAVISSPIDLEPVLAEIEHINDLGNSTWYEVVYFDGNWRCYAGSKTFKDGERVIKWKYAKDCL
jgi:hypothetical protein